MSNWMLRLGLMSFLVAAWALLQQPGTTASLASDTLDPDERFVLESSERVGKLSFEVLEDKTGIHLPSRLFFAHADGRQEMPTVGRFANILVTSSGQEIKTIPVGDYDVYITRGTEYSLDQHRIRISEGETTYLDSTLSRAIDTTGFISADFHLHLQFAMRDGAMVSAAEGLDLLTATDHNVLKDYSSYIAELNLGRFMTSVVGNEVDTEFGHFNSFPMSVNPWEDRTFRRSIRTPGEMLRLLRQNPGDEIVQINHPRLGSHKDGYFNGRIDPGSLKIEYPFFEASFDQLEVFNAITEGAFSKAGYFGRTPEADKNLRDWFSLLNRGIFMTGVANTDAHQYPKELPGYPRNYVLSETDRPWEIDPYRVVHALKEGASTASFGPFIRLSANDGAPVGSTIKANDRSVILHASVQAAPWIPVDKVEVIANGRVLTSYPTKDASAAVRFEQDIVVNPGRDTWYLLIATSERKWAPPFSNFRSFSFTNPIFVDTNGNGYFDPPNLKALPGLNSEQ